MWTITPQVSEVVLGPEREGVATFRVTNRGSSASNASLDVIPSESASASWFTVTEPHRRVQAGSSANFSVRIAVPSSALPAGHWLQGRVHSTDEGHAGGYTVSARVPFTIPVAGHGPELVPVPWVQGMPLHQAVDEIYRARLTPSYDYLIAGNWGEQYIVQNQSPGPLEGDVPVGSTVELTLEWVPTHEVVIPRLELIKYERVTPLPYE